MAFLLIKSLRDALSNGLVGSWRHGQSFASRAIGPDEIIISRQKLQHLDITVAF
jgi:hypothetical protein